MSGLRAKSVCETMVETSGENLCEICSEKYVGYSSRVGMAFFSLRISGAFSQAPICRFSQCDISAIQNKIIFRNSENPLHFFTSDFLQGGRG